MPIDRYGSDVLRSDPNRRMPPRQVPATAGLVLEDVESGWVGAVVRVEKSGGIHLVALEDRHGRVRSFPLGAGFWLEGAPVVVVPPRRVPTTAGPKRTASGSIAAPSGAPAKVARPSRIWVEGAHDAELVERIWGDDLRDLGVVVLMLDGVDNLAAVLREFDPAPGRRAGVLVDHLVAGSKETRVVREALAEVDDHYVKVLGHPYVDVWQAIKPQRVGLESWPAIPRGQDIKRATLAALGWPHRTAEDVGLGWKRLLGTVRSFRDLSPALLGRMEELIDFVTEEP